MKQLKPLHKLVNAGVRFIFGLPNSTPITQFSAQCHIIPLPYGIKNKICFYMYKVTFGSGPGYLSAIFHQRLPPRSYLRSACDKTAMATNSSLGMLCHAKYERMRILRVVKRN